MIYPKIQTVFFRDPATKFKTLLEGQYARPEFEYLAGNRWIWTEKVDGTNIRIMWDGEKIAFGGKTDRAQIPARLLAALNALMPDAARFAKVFNAPATLYGEGYGGKIQKGGVYRPDESFILFDVRVGDWWLQWQDVLDVGDKLGLAVVPTVNKGPLSRMVTMVRRGFASRLNGSACAEGIVARPEVELKARSGERIICKIKHQDFQ